MGIKGGGRPRRGLARGSMVAVAMLELCLWSATGLAQQAGPQAAVDQAVTLRPATVQAQPSPVAARVAELPAGAPLAVLARERLWLRVRTAVEPAVEGWIRLTDVRIRPAAPVPRPASTPAAPTPGGFAAFSRSVSGLLGAFTGQPASYGASNSTIGIRGLTAADLTASAPDAAALAAMERYAVPPQAAVDYATAGGLVPVRLQYLPPPAPARSAAPGAPWSRP